MSSTGKETDEGAAAAAPPGIGAGLTRVMSNVGSAIKGIFVAPSPARSSRSAEDATGLDNNNVASSTVAGSDTSSNASSLDNDHDELDDNFPRGNGYQLSHSWYKGKNKKGRYFLTSQLGTPFPSFHASPLPDFPARWCAIRGVRPPCENVIAPRIRLAPQELTRDKQFIMGAMREASATEAEHPMPLVLNLSHQSLGDDYQYEAFATFIQLNSEVEVLNLADNELEDISDISLPQVRKLYLSHNSFVSFLMLPELPFCTELYISDNFITGLTGLDSDKFPRMRKLVMMNNPVCRSATLRGDVKEALPQLRILNEHSFVRQRPQYLRQEELRNPNQ